MKQDQLNSLLRTLMTLIGAFLTGGGIHSFFGHIIDVAYWEEITGILLTVVAIGWSIASKQVVIEKLQGMVRQVVTFICGILVAKGLLNDSTATAVIAFIGAMLPYFQSGLARVKNQQLDSGKIQTNQLKGNFIKVLIFMMLLSSCKTTKINSKGETVLTANQKAWNKGHPHGAKFHKTNLQPIVLNTKQ